MNGLHSCKPGNEPQVGQVKTFMVEQRTGKSGKAYTKITSKAPDQGGQPYKILSAKPTGHTDSYGNHSFNIEVEPANGAPPIPQPSQQATGPGMPLVGQHSYYKSNNGDDRSSRIERQHSQEMALRYFDLGNTQPNTTQLRDMTSWFQRDIGHTPSAPVTQQPEPPPPPQSEPDDDEEIPF
jgi:hypothetical protein